MGVFIIVSCRTRSLDLLVPFFAYDEVLLHAISEFVDKVVLFIVAVLVGRVRETHLVNHLMRKRASEFFDICRVRKNCPVLQYEIDSLCLINVF